MDDTRIPFVIAQLTPSIGPMLIGTSLNLGALGVNFVQTYLYFCAFDGDPIFLKVLVLVVFTMGTLSTTLLSILTYSVIMVGTFSPSQLDLRRLGSQSALSLIGHMGPCIIQTYYAHRIRRLCGSYPVPALILLLALLQTSCVLIITGKFKRGPFAEQLTHPFEIFGWIYMGSTILCDLIIATSMIRFLSRVDVQSPRTRRFIRRLIRMCFATGFMTAVCTLMGTILFALADRSHAYITAISILGKVYAISFMALLNHRMEITHSVPSQEITALAFTSQEPPSHRSSSSLGSPFRSFHT